MSRVNLDPSGREPLEPLPLMDVKKEKAPRPTFDYVELGARSNFSFLQAASSPEAMVQRAAELGYDAVGIADRDGLYGIVRAHGEADKQGLRLVVGCELTIDPEEGDPEERERPRGQRPTLLVYVENHTGYRNLCRILTQSHGRYTKGKPRTGEGVPRNCFAGIQLSFVCRHAEGLWAIASASVKGGIVDAFGPRVSLGVHRHYEGGDKANIERVIAASLRFGVRIVAHNAVRYARRQDKCVFDVVTCIREGMTLDRAGRALSPNAEAYLKSEPEVRRGLSGFAGYDDWLSRSREIADACTFRMDELKYQFPFKLDDPASEGETPDQAIRRLTWDGARERLGEVPPKLVEQIEKELAVIARMNVAPYFLSVREVVEIAREKDILCQGRGSAANSVVCYCLGITAVDPEKIDVLFERFISAARGEPPDIDVDFEHERREEVIQYIYERYGRDHAGLAATLITYRARSALREVGKVMGLSGDVVAALSGMVWGWSSERLMDQRVREAGLDPTDRNLRMALDLAGTLIGFPRHLSQHVGGFVITRGPLHELVPIENAAMEDRTVIEWDKDDLDALNILKIDVLALGMLTCIRKAFALLERHKGEPFTLATTPPERPEVYKMLSKADSIGVFQVESRAQMSMLPRLKPAKFYDLVIEVAIVRPGPIQGDMVHPYLRRRQGLEKIEYPSPAPEHGDADELEQVLHRTLGVPLFQEQAMQIAIKAAKFTPDEADGLRRAMATFRH